MKIGFKRNIGPFDRVFRVLGGLFLVNLAFLKSNNLHTAPIWLIYLFGLSQILEGVIGY